MIVAINEAKEKLSKLGDLAHQGETIEVCKNGKPWFGIVPHKNPKRSTEPLAGVKPVISEQQALEQLAPEDIVGWS